MDEDQQASPPVEPASKSARERAVLGGPQVAIVLPPSADGASFEAWQRHLTFACSAELVRPDDAAAFHASTQLYMLGQFILSESTSSHANRLVRTGQDAARTSVDHLNISLHLEGTYEGRCGSRPFLAKPGDISFIDFGLPFDFETAPYRTLALTVPRSAMPELLRARELHGLVPDAGQPATRLLAQLMREVYASLPGLSLVQGVAAASAIVELAIAASRGDDNPREVPRVSDLDLYGRAQMAIERSLGDVDFSVGSLMIALDATRSALYRAFGDHGGVKAYIAERRLQRCYEAINGGDRCSQTLGAIAFSFGFRSEAHFSRTFKDRFGIAPRALRLLARKRGVDMLPPVTGGVAPDSIQRLGR